MSLRVYLESTGLHACSKCGHEDQVASGGTVYSRNITHNLTTMANEAGLYTACWRPGELKSPKISAMIRIAKAAGNYHEPGGVFELEKTLPVVFARDLIGPLADGLGLLKSDPARFEKFNASNGWGKYEHFVAFVEDYLNACRIHHDAIVTVSR